MGLTDDESDSLTYKGAWFEIDYPKIFTVKPSIPSSTPDLYDSAYFISPDKKVTFYVFSPQWSGDATDISLNKNTEVEKDTRTENKIRAEERRKEKRKEI